MNGVLKASEIASALQISRRAVQKRADREGWPRERLPGSAGAWGYKVADLPLEVRTALAQRRLTETAPAEVPAVPAETSAPPAAPAPAAPAPVNPAPVNPAPVHPAEAKGWQRQVRDARLRLLAEVRSLAADCGLGILAAEAELARLSQAGELPDEMNRTAETANNRKGRRQGITARSLRKWRNDYDKGGADTLLPKSPREAAGGPPPWLRAVLKLYLTPTEPSLAQVYEILERQGAFGAKAPTLRTVQREVAKLGPIARNRGRMGPRELKKLRPYVIRDTSDLEPMDVTTADGHTADWEVYHPHSGKPFRPELVAILDVATRRCVGWSAGLAESAFVVADALRKSIETAGVPAIFYVDNGPGFKNKLLDEAALGVMARAGITKKHSLPYNSQARGLIERFQATCWIRAAKRLPAYVGRDMDKEARQAVFKAGRRELRETGETKWVMDWDRHLAWAQEAIADYNARPHSALPKIRDPETGKVRHQSPDEAWDAWLDNGWQPAAMDAEELADLFRPYVIRKVNRGQVTVGKKVYFSQALDTLDLHGEEVRVGYDIHDPSVVYIRDLEDRPVCTAALDANRRGMFPKSELEESRERRARGQERRLRAKLDNVRDVLRPDAPRIEPAPRTAEEDAAHQKVLADLGGAQKRAFEPPRDELDRTVLRLELEEALANGEPVDPEAEKWARWYAATPRGQQEMRLHREFAEARRAVHAPKPTQRDSVS